MISKLISYPLTAHGKDGLTGYEKKLKNSNFGLHFFKPCFRYIRHTGFASEGCFSHKQINYAPFHHRLNHL
ncbi:hypothetical protein MARINOS108_10284 [Marinoscillum sp. 108]|nr:hypothetical protein MARINOS108_10284 [Marinoscillum sp. 108]